MFSYKTIVMVPFIHYTYRPTYTYSYSYSHTHTHWPMQSFEDICDRRKDLLIDECDANMLDMMLCD